MGDARINAALILLQSALAGLDLDTALNALAIQTGMYAALGAETKGDALSVIRSSQKQSRKIVEDMWGRPEIEMMRRDMRGQKPQ